MASAFRPSAIAARVEPLSTALRDAIQAKGVRERPITGIEEIGRGMSHARREADFKGEIHDGDAAWQAGMAAEWLARAHVVREAGHPTDALERVVEVYLPLVDAVEAGLWMFWITEDDVIAVAVPAARG